MNKPTLTREQAWGWEELMVVAAFRYCLGSTTYMSDVCAEWVVMMWPEFSYQIRNLIERDLEEAFRDDDRQRVAGERHKTLGYDDNRAAWEKVRALWARPGKVVE
jgi:hypothetical protein